jgi:spore coat polysaccharide biosynthesis protein SpsF
VPVFLGKGSDTLARFTTALEQCNAEGCVRILGDNFFIDPALIDRLVTTADVYRGCDYISYCSRDGRPSVLSSANVFGEWFRTGALRKAERLARNEADREHVTRYLYSHPDKFKIQLIPAPCEMDRDDVRLTVDLDEDWEHALAIYEALGPEHLEWQGIARLLDHQPAMRDRMAVLNRQHRSRVTV